MGRFPFFLHRTLAEVSETTRLRALRQINPGAFRRGGNSPRLAALLTKEALHNPPLSTEERGAA